MFLIILSLQKWRQIIIFESSKQMNRILEEIANRQLVTLDTLHQIVSNIKNESKETIRTFFQFAHNYPNQCLLAYTATKSINRQKQDEMNQQKQRLSLDVQCPEIISGYGNLEQFMIFQGRSDIKVIELIPIALFDSKMSSENAYQRVNKVRKPKIGQIKRKQTDKNLKLSPQNINNSKNNIKNQPKTAEKKTKNIESKKLPRVNTTKEGDKIFKVTPSSQITQNNNNNKKLSTYVKYESSDDERQYSEMVKDKIIQQNNIQQKFQEMDIQQPNNEELDEEAQFELMIKKQQEQSKLENRNTNLPARQAPKAQKIINKKIPIKAQDKPKPTMAGGQTSLFSFMNKK